MKRRMPLASVVVVLALVAAVVQLGSVAHASFPGTNGLIAYVSAGNVFVVDPANPVPVQITNTGNYTRVHWDPTGNKVVADQTAGLVLLSPVAGSAVTPIPNTTGADTRPAFDPSGTKLVFRNGGTGLATIGVDGSNRTNILNSAAATQPEWSSDGTFIAFATFPTSINRVSPTGSNLTTLASAGPGGTACAAGAPCETPTVKPDSTKVAFSQSVAANAGLAEVNANGTTATPSRLTTATNHTVPSYSPDGTLLSFKIGAIGVAGTLNRVASDGSGTITPVDAIGGVTWDNWGRTATSTPPVTFSVAGPAAKVKNGPCVFTVTASAAATGTVGFAAAVVSGKNVPSPATGTATFANATSQQVSVAVKHSKKKHGDVSLTLTTATGGSVGSPSSATCDVGKK